MKPNERLIFNELLNDIKENRLLGDLFELLCENQGINFTHIYTDEFKKFEALMKNSDEEKIEACKKLLKTVEIGKKHS